LGETTLNCERNNCVRNDCGYPYFQFSIWFSNLSLASAKIDS
jgi:hypothetical protein